MIDLAILSVSVPAVSPSGHNLEEYTLPVFVFQ